MECDEIASAETPITTRIELTTPKFNKEDKGKSNMECEEGASTKTPITTRIELTTPRFSREDKDNGIIEHEKGSSAETQIDLTRINPCRNQNSESIPNQHVRLVHFTTRYPTNARQPTLTQAWKDSNANLNNTIQHHPQQKKYRCWRKLERKHFSAYNQFRSKFLVG